MATDKGLVQCVVIAPQGKLASVAATSVMFPAHDGYIGIWPGHMPMLCRLGMGIMEIKPYTPEPGHKRPIRLFINRGFLMISSNHLTATVTEGVSFEGMDAEKIEQSLERVRRRISTGTFTKHQHWVENSKLTLLTRLAGFYIDANRQA